MALDTNIHHPKIGATALVSREAFDKIYQRKGWEMVDPVQAAELARKYADRNAKVQQEAQEEADHQAAAELAASGASPEEVASVTGGKDSKSSK